MLWMRLMLRWVSLATLLFINTVCDFRRLMHLFLIDFKNVSIVGHYVKDRTKDAQFIIIRYLLSAQFQYFLCQYFTPSLER
jgi:hypothetical protein